MPLEEWIKVWTYLLLGCLAPLAERAAAARPRFDTSTDMGLVLVPADAEVDSVIFRLRATDQDADFPLIFDITGKGGDPENTEITLGINFLPFNIIIERSILDIVNCCGVKKKKVNVLQRVLDKTGSVGKENCKILSSNVSG